MAYKIYWVTFLFLLTATAFYATRHAWLPYAPQIPYLTAPGPVPDALLDFVSWVRAQIASLSRGRYTRLPSSFQGDAEAGFSSSTFDLSENIEAGDSRQGLDDRGKAEVQRIMKERRVGFDDARRMWMEEKFRNQNIGKDGRPRDPKAVMFDRL